MIENDLSFGLQVLRPDGSLERLVIAATRVLIGAGAHCDIRIDGVGAGREHVELELEGENVIARARAHTPPPLVNGQPLVACKIDPGTQIAVCGTRITINVLRTETGAKRKGPVRRAIQAFGIAMMMIALPALLYAQLARGDDGAIGRAPAPTPLWAGPVTECKITAKDEAFHFAKKTRLLAEAKRERHPFAIEDGITAVTAFETAAACFRAAGRGDEAERDDNAGRALRKIVDRDYFAHRIRLEHAIDVEDIRGAIIECKILRRLTTGLKGPYVDWLGVVDRRLDLLQRQAENQPKGLF